jgi:cytochrome c2
MEAEDGSTIFTTCNKCHLILAQGDDISRVNVNLETGLDFVHPEDYDTIDEYTDCTECHTGGADLYE